MEPLFSENTSRVYFVLVSQSPLGNGTGISEAVLSLTYQPEPLHLMGSIYPSIQELRRVINSRSRI